MEEQKDRPMTDGEKEIASGLSEFFEEKKTYFARFRSVEIIEVLKVEVNEGDGTIDDPIIRVAYLTTKSGKVLAKIGEEIDRSFAGIDKIIDL